MKNYLDIPIDEKLFKSQFEDYTAFVFKDHKEYMESDKEQIEADDKLCDFIKDKISEKDYSEFIQLLNQCEIARGGKEYVASFVFYQLGLSDGLQLNKRFIKK
ncbi:MAG: hypothetical protein IKG14_04375 [Clostridia bacterium]|nr:hypothetical protein [Clostridia bacterium]